MTRYEILIKLNDEMLALDTYDVDPIQLVYNIADVKDISARNSSYSKTIKIPETGHNRLIFNDIGDLNNEGNFNPNLKTEAWVLVDTIVVFKGFLQLRNVITDLETGKRDYEIVIYADNDNFFKELGDDMLTDLDWTELNHVWDETNIVNSWSASTDNGYYYPLIDYGYNWGNIGNINGFNGNEVKVKNMFPATNVKYILDKIFSTSGYQYQSEFFNSDVFKNLYIPFNKKEFINEELVDSTNQLFSVGMLNEVTLNNQTTVFVPSVLPLPNLGQVDFGRFRFPFDNENEPYGDPNNFYDVVLFEYEATSVFQSQRFVVNIDITLPTADFVGVNGLTTSIWFARSKNPLTGVDTTSLDGIFMPINGSIAPIYPGSFQDGGLEVIYGATVNDPVRIVGQLSTDILDNSPASDGRFNKLFSNEKVTVRVRVSAKNTDDFHNYFGESPSSSFTIPINTFDIIKFNTNNIFFNVLNDAIVEGDIIPYISAIPKKFKQKDFITSLVKMFNLYIEPSNKEEKTLIIEPRDQYYLTGDVKDWTKKLDTTQNLDIQILGDTQNNEIILTYKEDNDFYNKDYLERKTAGEVYGQYNEFLDNDFVSGTKKIEPEFAATPLVAIGKSDIIIPNIYKENNSTIEKTESKPRILTRFYSSTKEPWGYDDFIFFSDSGQPNNAKTMLSTSGFTNVPHNFVVGDVVTITQSDGGSAQPWLNGTFEIVEIPDNLSIVIDKFFVPPGGAAVSGVATPVDGLVGLGEQTETGAFWKWRFEGTDYNLYPYLGHFNHPLKPNYDINYGQTEGLYYPTTLTTNENLFEIYWKNYIQELTDKTSRIITGNFYLNADDIANFKFNSTIFVDGQFYKINKITYDPTKTVTSTIELIKSNYEVLNLKQDRIIPPLPIIRNPDGTIPFNPIGPIRPQRNPGNLSSSSTNTIEGTSNIVLGSDNIVTNNNNYVAGVNNIITSTNNIITGKDNIIDSSSDRNLIIGSNNKVSSGFTSNVIFGNNIEIDRNNLFIAKTTSLIGSVNSTISEDQEDSAILTSRDSVIVGKSNNIISSSASTINNSGSTDDNFNNIIGSLNSEITRSIGTSVIASNLSDIDLNDFNPQLQSHNTFILGSYGSNIDLSIASNNGGDFNSSFILGSDNSAIEMTQDGGSGYIITDNQILGCSSCEIDIKTTITPFSNILHNSINNSSSSDIILTDVFVSTQNSISNSIDCTMDFQGGFNGYNSISDSSGSDIKRTFATNVYNSIYSSLESLIEDSFNSTIIGGSGNTISNGNNTILIGCDTITASQDDTVYVPNLVIVDSFTPTGSGDIAGEQGQITWDDDYIYLKTSVGWKRSTLSTF